MTEPVKAGLPEDPRQQEAYEKYLPNARALDPAKVAVRRDAELALTNVVDGYAAVASRQADLETRWPKARVGELGSVVSIALAAVFASSLASRHSSRDEQLARDLSEAYDLRDKLLSALETASKFGLVPKALVARLRAGRGSRDAAQDLVDLVAAFKDHAAALKGQTPVKAEHLGRADALGNALVLVLRPEDANAPVDYSAKEAADLANRFWTLLVAAHAELRRAGFELWGDDVDAHVPLLQSRNAPNGPREPTDPA